jgi:hypothetical protein
MRYFFALLLILILMVSQKVKFYFWETAIFWLFSNPPEADYKRNDYTLFIKTLRLV